jgi:endo-1,4-beta-xylanase
VEINAKALCYAKSEVHTIQMKGCHMKYRVLSSIIIASGIMLTHSSAQPLATGKSKFLGNVISNGNSIRSDFKNYWNQVTPENSGKWGSVEGSQDSYGWAPLDLIYNYALANNFSYKHHAFVWGQQYPSWITSLDSAHQRTQVEEWIRLCAQRYPKMNMVDVVNEPLHAPPPFKNALGGDGATGWDWVVTSFSGHGSIAIRMHNSY